jgi:hypothetical protein
MRTLSLLLALPMLPIVLASASAEDLLPGAIAAFPGESVVLKAHAVGQQIYQCKAGADGKLAWALLEPIASLMVDGKLVGRHFKGPTWELADGSAVVGKAIGNAPGQKAGDIAWLKLEVVSRSGSGKLSDVTTVQRINTLGGTLEDSCDRPGTTRGMPYAADYVFLRKS